MEEKFKLDMTTKCATKSQRIFHIQKKPCHTGSPTTIEIKTAEILWTKEAQRNMDTKQLESQLGLFVDEDQVIVTRDVWVMQKFHMLRDFLPCCLVVIGSLL